MIPHTRLLGLGLAAALGLLLARPARAQQPPAFAAARLITVSPGGCKVGSSGEVTLAGTDLEEAQLWFSHPGIKAEPVSGSTGKFKVTVAPDVPPGSYDVRAVGKWGLSNPRIFVASTLEEVVEQEPNNDVPQAQKVPLNCAVSGVVSANTDVDYYSFEGKKGTRVVVHCASTSVDSRLTPMLELFDARDRRLAGNRQFADRDAVLDAVLPEDGTYVVRVCEFAYQAANAEYFYRLSISTAPWIDAVFPPVVEPGKPNKLLLVGRNLPNARRDKPNGSPEGPEWAEVTVTPPSDPARLQNLDFRGVLGGESFGVDGYEYRVKNDVGPSNPVLLAYARAPVVLDNGDNDTPDKAQKITLPAEVCGRIERRGDRDRYLFQAKQGDVWVFEGFADRLGSPFDLYFEVRRTDNGQSLGEFDDNADQPPTFGKFFTRSDDPKGRVQIPADGTYELVVASRTGDTQGGPRYVYRISVTKEEPDFRLVLVGNVDSSGAGFTVRKGGHQDLLVVCQRHGGFNGEITLTAEGLPEGVTCAPQVLGPNQKSTSLVLSAAEDAAETMVPFRVKGTAQTPGGDLVREARAGCLVWPTNQPQIPALSRLCQTLCLAVREPGPFTLGASSQEVTVTPGGTASVKVTLNRRWQDFKGQVTLVRLAGPAQPNGQPLQLPNVVIGPGQNEVEVKFPVPNNTPTGSYNVVFLATAQLPFAKDGKGNKQNVAFTEPSPPIRLNVFSAAAEVSVEKPLVVLKPGAEQKLGVKVKRLGGLQGELTVQLVPPKTLDGVSAETVTVPAKADDAVLLIKAAPKAKLGVSPDVVVKLTGKSGQQTITAEARLKVAVTEDGAFEETEPRGVAVVTASSDGWRYQPAAKVQGDTWRKPDFDDSGWKKGKAPIGYGEDEITTRKGTLITEQGQNVLFRRTFDLPADVASKAGVTYRMNVASDDTAVVYVNGEKVDEDPEDDHEFKYWNREVDVPSKLLKPGKNVIAVLVKNKAGSSDLYMDVELVAQMPGGKKK